MVKSKWDAFGSVIVLKVSSPAGGGGMPKETLHQQGTTIVAHKRLRDGVNMSITAAAPESFGNHMSAVHWLQLLSIAIRSGAIGFAC